MKRKIRSVLSMVFVLAMLLALAVPAFAVEKRSVRNINQVYGVVCETSLASVYSATLYADGKTAQSVYYVVCRGLDVSELDPSKPLSFASAVRISISDENNSYVTALAKIVRDNVPTGSRLVFAGHSLGGMVVEQAIARKEIKNNYQVLYSVTMGSPYILTRYSKEGTLRRMVDPLDPVPYLNISLLAVPSLSTACIESSRITPYTHTRSYGEGSCWAKYDALGKKNGSAYIELGDKLYG